MTKSTDFSKATTLARTVIGIEADALRTLRDHLDDNFPKAVEIILRGQGRVVVIGMGKSGHIGGKIAATLASTGTPAFFVHPGEASHGDLGMITGNDIVLAISYSGETSEIITILPLIKRLGIELITLTGNPMSTLARAASANLDVHVSEEACPLNLAPTASTTATLAMGDALAVSLLEIRGFTADDFARSHPGGALGKRLLLMVEDVMRSGDDVPIVHPDALFRDGLVEMTSKGLGMTAVANDDRSIVGIFTDGDLRRTFDNDRDLQKATMKELIRPDCRTIRQDVLAVEAVRMLDEFKITALLVVDGNDRLIGALNVHDLLRAGVM